MFKYYVLVVNSMNNEKKDDTRTLIQKKADAYLVLGGVVHISLTNGNWKNGIVKDVRSEFLILTERLEGDIPLFFQEILTIEPYTTKKVDLK